MPELVPVGGQALDDERLLSRYRHVRGRTEALTEPLGPEWSMVQADAQCSPSKWHLAHTTWFFDRFILGALDRRPGSRTLGFDPDRLLNSYYQSIGQTLPQVERALLASPSAASVLEYRWRVDEAVTRAMADGGLSAELRELMAVGLAHEEQHQELVVTDQLAARARHPDHPAWPGITAPQPAEDPGPVGWIEVEAGLAAIGCEDAGFAYDNERPRHPCLLHGAWMADRLVTNGEYLAFISAGGYRDHRWWCDAGWDTCLRRGWAAPERWQEHAGTWCSVTAAGLGPLEEHRPVTHISWFEADAYARWCDARLPTEAEWEVAATLGPSMTGAQLESGSFQPAAAPARHGALGQIWGDCWEWTASPYRPYPGYRPPAGALGEYNGKFMCDRFVLRGGSCATPQGHVRASYRNFFHPETRWQFSGLRLARDLT